MNYLKYAFSQYFTWLGYFSIVIGVIAIYPIEKCVAIVLIIICGVIAFIIPFFGAIFRKSFKLKTIGKSSISFTFDDMFNEKCFVITTNRFFDVNPTGEWVAPSSVLGIYAGKYFQDDIGRLESLILAELGSIEAPYEYGKTVKIKHDGKIVYLLVLTDRKKTEQPKDFYEKSLQGLFEFIINENHGEIISIPLIGDNNDLSDTGFDDSVTTFESIMAMINSFETRHQRSGIKLKIVALPEKRAELVKAVYSYSNKKL